MVVLVNAAALTAPAQTSQVRTYAELSGLFGQHQIALITIIHVSSHIETPVRVDDKSIRRLAGTHVTFRHPDELGILDNLAKALREIDASKPTAMREVRWGILLYDQAGNERASIFLDTAGTFMQVKDAHLGVQGQTLAWIKESVRDALQ
jgi:hypothetical protein